ncbi:hypothetical protein [Streptococcus pneumoniae]|uniref:hypothetical protein n=1 Tax=Streptococcus pneumoniae TaxID=1313 RepID=UPI0015D9C5E6|nr:hypothetical protein [Streptococcus pneumoniae]
MLKTDCSKHCFEVADGFEVADRTDECFEVVDRTDEVSNHTYGKDIYGQGEADVV